MSVYCVSYDLNQPGQKYSKVHEILKSFSKWYHIMDSTWLISTTNNAIQIRDKLSPHLDNTDKLIVSRVDEYSGWLTDDEWNWLTENVK
ncbi:hypothetical protein CGI14_21165 [Vibrio parahaemolyticus]|nr:hypothetical protein CGI14_21165 [Vibrio parahaemolyticus]